MIFQLRRADRVEDFQEESIRHDSLVRMCPCGCLSHSSSPGPFRTREQSSLALYLMPQAVLQHQGNTFSPSDIALFWKKDCRKYLWKGIQKREDSYNDSICKYLQEKL